MEAHRKSYFLRITSILCDYIFNHACVLFSKELISSLLIDFFLISPSGKNIIEAVRPFPKFLREHFINEDLPYLADFIEFSLHKHDILHAEDPVITNFINNKNIQANKIYFQKKHLFMKSSWPIFQLWVIAKELNKLFEENSVEFIKVKKQKLKLVQCKPETLIIVKSSSVTLEVVNIPLSYEKLATILSHGKSLEYAIENFNFNDLNFDPEHFSQWIALMTEKRVFITGD